MLQTRIEQDVLDELKILSSKENRPVSNYIETVLKKHIDVKNTREHSEGELYWFESIAKGEGKPIVFKDGVYATKDPEEIEILRSMGTLVEEVYEIEE